MIVVRLLVMIGDSLMAALLSAARLDNRRVDYILGGSMRERTTHNPQQTRMERKRSSSRTIEARVRRIVGQVEALERMVADGHPCLEITQQIAAARSALGGLAVQILKERGLCGGGAKQTAELERIVDAVMRYS